MTTVPNSATGLRDDVTDALHQDKIKPISPNKTRRKPKRHMQYLNKT
jgi:hypothetical protein